MSAGSKDTGGDGRLTWAYTIDSDAILAMVGRHCPRHIDDGAFAGGIQQTWCSSLKTSYRSHVDDTTSDAAIAGRILEHRRNSMFGHDHHAGNVDFESFRPCLYFDILCCSGRAQYPNVVDQNVQAAVLGNRCSDTPGAVAVRGDVSPNSDRRAGALFLYHFHGSLGGSLVAVDAYDRSPILGQEQGNGSSIAKIIARCSGPSNDCDFSAEISSRPWW
ncbi:hypothetical protein NHJ13051_008414 [Beauveria bassiana]